MFDYSCSEIYFCVGREGLLTAINTALTSVEV